MSDTETHTLKLYTTMMRDYVGDDLIQEPLHTPQGTLVLHLWSSDLNLVLTQREVKRVCHKLPRKKPRRQQRGGDAR